MSDAVVISIVSAVVAIALCAFVTVWIFRIHNMRLKLSGFGLRIEIDGFVRRAEDGSDQTLIVATKHGELESQPMLLIADRRRVPRNKE